MDTTAPTIFYPPADDRGKWHRANRVTDTALCGQPVIVDTSRLGEAITLRPGVEPHPILCRLCQRMH